jgi:TPR repeat protein
MTLKRLLLAVSMCCLVTTANAAPLDDAYAAYQRGDYAQALELYRPLAAQGFAYAQNSLGWMYHKGQGVTQNNQEAVKWLKLSAVQGIAYAQSNLGYMYLNGYGVTQDHQEALKLFRLAAAQGEPNAIENLKLPGMVVAAQQYQQTYQPTPQPKSESNKTDMTSAMSKCSDLGFKKGTEKFGDCVLKLSK